MELLKDINNSIKIKDPVELVLEEVNSSMAKRDVERLVKYWKENMKGMSTDELREAIGDELEQLEYSPEEVEKMVPKILKMVIGK